MNKPLRENTIEGGCAPQFSGVKCWSITKGVLIAVSSYIIAVIEVLLIIEYAWRLIGKGGTLVGRRLVVIILLLYV